MSVLTLDTEAMFAGGRLCLDFINTACMCRGAEVEFIGGGEELRRWIQTAETIFGRELCGDDDAEYWEGALPQAIALRSALRKMVHSVLEQTTPPAQALQTVNAVLGANPAYIEIGYGSDGFQESARSSRPSQQWLSAIAADAVDVLCHTDLSLLRQCACPTCVRVFYDTTKNHKRRWCVEKCGSAPKAAAYYRRKIARAAQLTITDDPDDA